MNLFAAWRTRLTMGFIVGFVAVQALLPLRYYLSRDRHDERFAWRMFSPMRMTRCAPVFAIDDKAAALGAEFHEAWVQLAQRGRLVVVEGMGQTLCTRHATSTVRITMTCSYMDGTTARLVSYPDGRMRTAENDAESASDVCDRSY